MAEPFLSEIRLMSFSFAPSGWALCNGQFLPINQNQALFALLGTTFGGNGMTTFALPDFRNRVPIHAGNGHTLGERAGSATHTLSIAELPTHTHSLAGSPTLGNSVNPAPAGGTLFAAEPGNPYTTATPGFVALESNTVANVGGSQAHENRQPSLVISFCIALQGIFPSPN